MMEQVIGPLLLFGILLLVAYKIDQMLADIRAGRQLLERIATALEKKNAAAATGTTAAPLLTNVSPTGIVYKPPKA